MVMGRCRFCRLLCELVNYPTSICKSTLVSLVTIRPNHTLGTSELPDELTFLALSAVPTVPRDVDTVRIMHNGRRCG